MKSIPYEGRIKILDILLTKASKKTATYLSLTVKYDATQALELNFQHFQNIRTAKS